MSSKIPLITSVTTSMLMVNVYFSMAFAFDPSIKFSMDPTHGVFGWMVPEQLYLTLGLGLFSGFFASGGTLISLYFVSPVLMGNMMLLEPISA